MNWYGIKDACKLVGKSESTLRKIAKTKRKGIKFETLATGHKKILFSDEFLTIEFGNLNNSFDDSAIIETDSSAILDLLSEQIRIKDEQIKELNERLRESHILIQNSIKELPNIVTKKRRFLFWSR